MAFFDEKVNYLEGLSMNYCDKSNTILNIPNNITDMIKYAEILSGPFPHVRVDFYNVDGKIYFGELTFFGASGYQIFNPDTYDYTLGKMFQLPERNK